MTSHDELSKERQAESRPLLFEGFHSEEARLDALRRFEQYLQMLAKWDGRVRGEFGPPSLN